VRAGGLIGLYARKGEIAMRKFFSRNWIFVALLSLFSGALIAQTAGQGILFGNWQLNVAKSSFGGGTKLMSMITKVTSDMPDLIQFSVNQTTADGFEVSYSYKGAADGKEYPIVGSSSVYSYTEEQGVVHETQKDSDGTITQGDFTVSANGKVGTWLYTITNPDGTVVKQKLVFDRTQ
jgi:hypothetical protein